MPKYAPVYMPAAYDGPDYTLDDLVLSASGFTEGDPEDTVIGTLSGMAEDDSTLSIVETDDYVKLDGNDLVVGSESAPAGPYTVTIRETNSYGVVTTHDTEFEITVNSAE